MDTSTVWTDLMKLTQLSSYDIQGFTDHIPFSFFEWMKTSALRSIPRIDRSQRQLAPLFLDVLPVMPHLQSLNYKWFFGEPEKEVLWLIDLVQKCTQITELDLEISHRQISLFVPVLAGLTNLVTLRLESDLMWTMPPLFFTLNFPQLKFLRNILIASADVSAFGTWLDRHAGLEELRLTLESQEDLYQSQLFDKCTALISLDIRLLVKPLPSFCLTDLPPTLRKLMWRPSPGPNFLPNEHQLTHFGFDEFDNNIRRHRSLVDLHTDWLDQFWVVEMSSW